MTERVERFRLHPLRNVGYQLVPDPEGEYMRFSDAQKLAWPEDYYDALSASEAKCAALEAALDFIPMEGGDGG